jgi:polar amino acid transport system permease protein
MTQLVAGAPILIAATVWTLLLFLGGAALALALSFVAGISRISTSTTVRAIAAVYTEVFRGVSLVVQLFWIYFALPAFGIRLSAIPAAVLGLGLCFGAYGSEIVRSSILAVSSGQSQAARALGLSGAQTMFLVVLPQALLIMLPPFGNLFIQLLKSTAVAALITVPELTFQATAINNNYGGGWAIFTFVLIIYFSFSKVILASINLLTRRFSMHISIAAQ